MREAVTISPCKHPRYSFRVRFPGEGGKRRDRFFTNETAALEFAKLQQKQTGQIGTDFGSITEQERGALAYWRAFVAEADPKPPELVSVMKDFRREWTAAKASVKLSTAVDFYLSHQAAEGAGDRHRASLRSRLGRLTADHGEQLVSTITTAVFTDWLNGLRARRADKEGGELTLTTRANLCRSLRSFFAFAVDRGWTLANPVPVAKRSKSKAAKLAKRKVPEVMPPEDVQRFLDAVRAKAPALLAFWALKFFAGIRDAEVARMDWAMIDLPGGEIHLPAAITKTGEARTVKIEPNLGEWLRAAKVRKGKVAGPAKSQRYWFRKVMKSLETRARGKVTAFRFPSNAARHSFGTYHLYAFRNAGETALQLGHKGNPAMLHEHYKNPAAERQAAAFWAIRPGQPGNVVTMERGVA